MLVRVVVWYGYKNLCSVVVVLLLVVGIGVLCGGRLPPCSMARACINQSCSSNTCEVMVVVVVEVVIIILVQECHMLVSAVSL